MKNSEGGLFPIIVASKHRPLGSVFDLLREEDIPWLTFVEPQDQDVYEEYDHEISILPKNNQGLPYVRQKILEYAVKKKLGWYWLLDDDIKQFYKVDPKLKKCIPCSVKECLLFAQRFFQHQDSVAQGALEYQQFGWGASKAYVVNSYADVAVAIHAQKVHKAGVKFRPETDLKVDRDFTLQILASGYNMIRVTRCCFAAPKNASNKGGLQEAYLEEGREKKSSLTMVKLWGSDICKFKPKPDGRPDVAINWRYFARK